MKDLDTIFEKRMAKKTYGTIRWELKNMRAKGSEALRNKAGGGPDDPLNVRLDDDTSMIPKGENKPAGVVQKNDYTVLTLKNKKDIDEAFETSADSPPTPRNSAEKKKKGKGKGDSEFELYKTKNVVGGPEGDEANFPSSYGRVSGLGPNNYNPQYESSQIAESIMTRIHAKYK
jgi:hypothetical protein